MRAVPEFHSLAEARSWALHQEVAARLASQPRLIERAKQRVAKWLSHPSEHPYQPHGTDYYKLHSNSYSKRSSMKASKCARCGKRVRSPEHSMHRLAGKS